jgi:hypothetical protein
MLLYCSRSGVNGPRICAFFIDWGLDSSLKLKYLLLNLIEHKQKAPLNSEGPGYHTFIFYILFFMPHSLHSRKKTPAFTELLKQAELQLSQRPLTLSGNLA